MSENFFLRKKLHYYLTLSVIATTLFSWFNINSYLIILLLLCRLFDGSPRVALKSAFTNIFFLAYSAIFLIEFAGLFYTHHLFAGWRQMEGKATLVAIPFIFCAGPFTDNNGYRKLFTAYCLLLAAVCLYCLSMAVVEYRWQQDIDVFFYHQLTSPVGVNAIFFSGYLFVALLFLLYSTLSPVSVFSRPTYIPDRFFYRDDAAPFFAAAAGIADRCLCRLLPRPAAKNKPGTHTLLWSADHPGNGGAGLYGQSHQPPVQRT